MIYLYNMGKDPKEENSLMLVKPNNLGFQLALTKQMLYIKQD